MPKKTNRHKDDLIFNMKYPSFEILVDYDTYDDDDLEKI